MKRVIMLCLGMVVCAATVATAQPQRLTLAQALDLLHTNNPTLRSARAHQSAVQSGEVTAALRVNPTIGLANEDFNVFEPSKLDPANTQEFTDTFAWTFERGGKRRYRVASAQAATVVGRDALADTQRQLDFQLRTVFVSALLADRTLALAQDNLTEYRKVMDANTLRLQAGDISETEYDRIALEESRFQTDLLNAQAAVTQSRAQLAALLGMKDPLAVEADGSLDTPALTASLQDALRLALEHRPDLKAARDITLKSQADVNLARANGATDLVAIPEYKRNGPDNTLGFTLQFPLKMFDRNQGEKLRAGRELDASRFAENAAELQVISDVHQAWAAYEAASARSKLYSQDYLQRAKNVRDRMAFSYEHGATGLLEYIDAIRSYRDVELAAQSSNAQLLTAIYQLEFATATEMLP